MKFLILNGPNVNLQRYSEPGMPGELDYNGMMDYVQSGCDQMGIETDVCQTNHAGDLIDELQAAAEAYIEKIDAMGGAVKAIEQGYIQREIAESSYQYQRQVESGEQIVVGVNKFTIEEPPAKGLLHIDASVAANQVKKLQEMKAARDNVLVRQRLDALRTAAEGSDNLMPYILDCARVYCTEGEICGELRKVFGEYRPMEVL